MSSNKDKIRDWFFALPEETKEKIDYQIENIRNQEDVTERHQQTLTKMVKELARMLEPLVDDPSQISAIIKAIANGRISDDVIEKALPEAKKRTYKRYQSLEIPLSGITNDKERPPLIVTSDGSESYTKADGSEGEREAEPTKEQVLETSTEIAFTLADQYAADAKDRDLRLNEALRLADDKDKRIEQLLLQMGELELQITDLKNKPQPKNVDTTEDLQIENDNMKQTIIELQEALRAKVKASGFTQASQLPKQVWLAAINAINFYRELNKASRYAIENNDPWKKIIFDVAEDGQLKAAKLEGQ